MEAPTDLFNLVESSNVTILCVKIVASESIGLNCVIAFRRKELFGGGILKLKYGDQIGKVFTDTITLIPSNPLKTHFI